MFWSAGSLFLVTVSSVLEDLDPLIKRWLFVVAVTYLAQAQPASAFRSPHKSPRRLPEEPRPAIRCLEDRKSLEGTVRCAQLPAPSSWKTNNSRTDGP